jgi:hypothetical protein
MQLLLMLSCTRPSPSVSCNVITTQHHPLPATTYWYPHHHNLLLPTTHHHTTTTTTTTTTTIIIITVDSFNHMWHHHLMMPGTVLVNPRMHGFDSDSSGALVTMLGNVTGCHPHEGSPLLNAGECRITPILMCQHVIVTVGLRNRLGLEVWVGGWVGGWGGGGGAL